MKENVLDVLMYLFDHVFDVDMEVETDQDTLSDELEAAGFEKGEIDKAFDWLDDLRLAEDRAEGLKGQGTGSIRIYADRELQRLSPECHGFMVFMEQCGIVDAQVREMIIERALALGTPEISLDHLKWVTLMVLCNCNREDGPPVEWVEELMLDEFTDIMH
jgi:Smg protein